MRRRPGDAVWEGWDAVPRSGRKVVHIITCEEGGGDAHATQGEVVRQKGVGARAAGGREVAKRWSGGWYGSRSGSTNK